MVHQFLHISILIILLKKWCTVVVGGDGSGGWDVGGVAPRAVVVGRGVARPLPPAVQRLLVEVRPQGIHHDLMMRRMMMRLMTCITNILNTY